MTVQNIMTTNPVCCNPDTSLQRAAKLMVEYDCGEIPVVGATGTIMGVITDRDIVCRAVATGADCASAEVQEFMTSPAVTVKSSASLDECCELMEQNQIRRIPVVNDAGECCGIVAQADFAAKAQSEYVDSIVKEVSKPTGSASNV